jgi:bifunctional non-homologous end joining protein LigD
MVRVSAFIKPCLPSRAERPPSGPGWVYEIKHDGFRMMVRRDGAGVRLLTRRGNDWSDRYPLIAAAVGALRVRSCLIDGEAIACGEDGLPAFDRVRYRRQDGTVFLFAFDLLELDGVDLRQEPLELRKATLASLLRKGGPGVGSTNISSMRTAKWCSGTLARWGCEGIVSKRLGSRYRSGRSPDWLKFKNPDAPAVKRKAEEEWGAR